MSMLTRKGTMVRKARGTIKKKGVSRTRSGGSGRDDTKTHDSADDSPAASTPIQHKELGAKPSPAKSSASTVVSIDDGKRLYHTSVRWSSRATSTDQTNHGEVFFQLREACKESEGTCDFVCRVSDIICHTVCITIGIAVFIVIPIAMVSIGMKYLSDCPKAPKIPVYLLVGGCFGILKIIGALWKNIQIRRYESMDAFYDSHDSDTAFASRTFKIMDAMLTTFLFGWQIAGTYWVFRVWQPHYEQLLHEPSNWCEKTVYMFSVFQIVGCYALLCLGIIILGCLAMCYKYTSLFDR